MLAYVESPMTKMLLGVLDCSLDYWQLYKITTICTI